MSNLLHPRLGANPRTAVAVCGGCAARKESKTKRYLGIRNHKDVCTTCGAVYYGGVDVPKEGAPHCVHCNGNTFNRVELEDGEPLLAYVLCPKCAQLLAEGGVIFRASTPLSMLGIAAKDWANVAPKLEPSMDTSRLAGRVNKLPKPWWEVTERGVEVRDPKLWLPQEGEQT